MGSQSLATFNRLRLASQYNMFGESAVIDGVTCVVCASAHRGQSALEDGGLGIQFARTVRCRRADFSTPPKEGHHAVIGGTTYRMASVTSDALAGEYVLGLEQRR